MGEILEENLFPYPRISGKDRELDALAGFVLDRGSYPWDVI